MKPRYTDTAKYPHGYDHSSNTDIRRRFERLKREAKANAKEVAAKVEPLKRKANGR